MRGFGEEEGGLVRADGMGERGRWSHTGDEAHVRESHHFFL